MAGIENNLYPPIIASWMPAYVRTAETFKISFSLSSYNSESDIKNVQVVITNQNNNRTALSTDSWPAGILIADLESNIDTSGDDKYCINIKKNDLIGKCLEVNQYYKVQLRFTSIAAEDPPSDGKIASWVTANQDYFSEWSTVCIIKGIEQPQLTIKNFITDDGSDTIFTTELTHIVGNLDFIDINGESSTVEKEYLKSYQFLIDNQSTKERVFDSGIEYTSNYYNYNQINYILTYALEDGVKYKITVVYTTSNGYSDSKSYVFTVIRGGDDPLEATISAEADEENGRVAVSLVSTTGSIFLGNVAIRRASNLTNFAVWEDVNIATISGESLNYTWYDYTVECGVWYKYCAQKISTNGERGLSISIRKPIMLNFEDIFLNNGSMQLKVEYDPNISSYKPTISESRTETIGSQFPFIKRNGALKYKTFPLTGLITSFCDEDGLFISKDSIYGDYADYYAEYNSDNDINDHYDIIYEKKFRDKVIDFLFDNSVKLFRSSTEGNILIKLMDISFTPNSTLGRMLYSFSATAYEIDECSVDNYNEYGISTIGDYSTYVNYIFDKASQISGTFNGRGENVYTAIEEQINNNQTITDYATEVDYLSYVKIEFQSDPYLIDADTLKPAGDGSTNTILGYVVYINNQAIYVNTDGIYELAGDGVKVTSIWFPRETTVLVDFIAKVEEYEAETDIVTQVSYYVKAGQLQDVFLCGSSVVDLISEKYASDDGDTFQKILSIDQLSIEAEPGTVLYIKDSYDDNYYRHVIGDTGVLSFYDDEAVVTDFYFNGIHLDDLSDYEVNNEQILYNGQWYTLNENNDVECPVEALVDYIYELEKGVY